MVYAWINSGGPEEEPVTLKEDEAVPVRTTAVSTTFLSSNPDPWQHHYNGWQPPEVATVAHSSYGVCPISTGTTTLII
jgi:hypothetical protein